jgi:hypothetical protein
MKNNIFKILMVVALMTFVGAGASLADGWKGEGGPRGHAYGHYKHGEYQYCAPRPVYVERHYYPVVIERHVYHPPAVYQTPAPSGYVFGMSVIQPGISFSFGMSGH